MAADSLMEGLIDEIPAWVDANWNHDLTVREWWRRLFDAGLSYPAWPEGLGGRGTSAAEGRAIHGALAAHRVVGPPVGHVAAGLAAPTILDHGTAEQIAAFVPSIARGEAAWCQLFSEPGSGSDLASVGARAVRDGDEWVVSGQKVWNSGADQSQFGMLLARTDVDRPKHRGITYLLIDMDQPGIEVRPLKQMNGDARFCEVFIDEARVPADRVLGELNGGWAVAQTTLLHERTSIAGAGFAGFTPARSGDAAGDLDRTVGEIIERARATVSTSRTTIAKGAIPAGMMVDLARQYGVAGDPMVRQRLAAYHSEIKINGWLNRRIGVARGKLTGADGSLSKMTTSRICQVSRDLSYSIVGADALLDGADGPMGGEIQRVGLASPGTRIGGGTDEIQLNVIGERGLGLPREPGTDQDTPYRDLKVGTQR
jgi:alkylation response protein AidB-like acyl-CoA dehydrogenase